jgi:aminoglycoside/choline kinase family phosphotransferase
MEGPDPSENATWFQEGRKLHAGGFPLPEIMGWDLARGFFLLEDLGDVLLCYLEPGAAAAGAGPGGGSFEADGEFAVRCRRAAEVMAALHDGGWAALAPVVDVVAPPYDAGFVLAHEWSYFLSGARLMGMEGDFERTLAAEGRKIAALAGSELERSFIHRDFQSRNVLVREGGIFLVDWQGGRLGPPYYDLASLIFDPYTDLSLDAREDVAAAYLAARASRPGADEWRGRTRFFGMVRLMQAAGAYAHLAAAWGKPEYARYLPRALVRARALSDDMPGGSFPGLTAFFDDYLSKLPGMLDGVGTCAL